MRLLPVVGLTILLSLQGPVQAYPPKDASSLALMRENLIKTGEQSFNFVCLGHGTPTVVFEYGLGSHLLTWQKIAEPVSRFTTACFYDRAGYGFSSPSGQSMTAGNVVRDLHKLLQQTGVSRPVLVGHSIGGLYATLYADRYINDVSGLVLIDPSFAGQGDPGRNEAEKRRDRAEAVDAQAQILTCAALAWRGQLNQADPHECFQGAPGRSREELDFLMKQFLKPYRYESTASEMANFIAYENGQDVDSREEQAAMRSFGRIPLVMLTAGNDQPAEAGSRPGAFQAAKDSWRRGHDALAARSTRSRSIVVADSGHFIQIDRPEVVVEAIRDVVTQVRNSAP